MKLLKRIWCRHQESNPGPTDYKSGVPTRNSKGSSDTITRESEECAAELSDTYKRITRKRAREIDQARWSFVWFIIGMFVMAFILQRAHSYDTLIGPQPHQTRVWYYNESDCGATGTRLKAAVALWNQYGARLVYGGESNAEKQYDGQSTFYCLNVLDFMERLGKPFGVLGTTYYWYENGVIIEADLVLNSPASDCTILHEVGHVLGLGHSTVYGSVMRGNSGCRGLHYDDIQGLGALYGFTPDCTPWFNGEFAYFPAVGGMWAYLEPVKAGDLSKGLVVADYGPSEGEWECPMLYDGNTVETPIYYKGRTYEVRLKRKDGLFYLF